MPSTLGWNAELFSHVATASEISAHWHDLAAMVTREDIALTLPQIFNGLILAVAVRHQIDRRFSL